MHDGLGVLSFRSATTLVNANCPMVAVKQVRPVRVFVKQNPWLIAGGALLAVRRHADEVVVVRLMNALLDIESAPHKEPCMRPGRVCIDGMGSLAEHAPKGPELAEFV